MYNELKDEFEKARRETRRIHEDLHQKQHRYIQREQEYKDVIKKM